MPWVTMPCLLATLLLRLVDTALAIYMPHADGAFMETVVQVYKDGDLSPVWMALVWLLGLHFLSGVGISTVQNLLLQSFTQFREQHAQSGIYAHVMDHEAAFHDETEPIEIIYASDMGVNVCDALDFLVLETGPQITQFIGTGITVFSLYGSHVALIQLTVISIYTLITLRSNRILMPIYDERTTARQDMRRRREGGIKGWRTVAHHAQASREIEAYTLSLDTYMKLVWKIQIFKTGSQFCLRLIVVLGEFATTALVILREIQIGGTVGSVVAFRGYWSLLQSPLQFFIHIPEKIIRDLYDADRLRRIMEVKPSMMYGSEDLPLTGGRIEFKNVTFGYTSDKLVFKELNLVIEPGKTTAIVGPSGVGKTTLLDLIVRFYDPHQGSIEIDGRDVKTLQRSIISNRIAVMAQSPHLFNDTAGDNIKYGQPDATVREMHEAAERAGIHSTIIALDNGYDTMVGEGGKNFSGGERQRIALARTLMRVMRRLASVILFDEATSALDADSETHVKETLKSEFAGKTIVVIAQVLPLFPSNLKLAKE